MKKKEPTYPLTKKEEDSYKKKIELVRTHGFQEAIEKYGDAIGENVGTILKSNLPKIRHLVVERSAKKWINPKTRKTIISLVKEGQLSYVELHDFATSISNTLRPLAGGSFETMVCDSINQIFEKKKLSLRAVTKGEIRKKLKNKLEDAYEKNKILKPDIDVVVFDEKTKDIILIISCKTTFRERLMQSISWKNYFMSSNDNEIKNIKVFLVTAWETLDEEIMRNRVAILDGVYVTDSTLQEKGKIKKFGKIYSDIEQVAKSMAKI